MTDSLNVEVRETLGKRNNRRLRAAGGLPAVLYGHGHESTSLRLDATALAGVIRHGGRLVELAGGVAGSALIREIQWDAFGHVILHVDLVRVDKDEKLELTVPVELRGQAPGVSEGGIVEHLVHEIEIETVASAIPERLHININKLRVGEELTAAAIENLPAGARLLIESDTIIVQCVLPIAEAEEVSPAGSVEPELIGRKAEEDEEEE